MTLAEQDALGLINREMTIATDKHGPLPQDTGRRLRILVSEVGEVADAMGMSMSRTQAMFPGRVHQPLREELAQVAATCIKWIAATIEEEVFVDRNERSRT